MQETKGIQNRIVKSLTFRNPGITWQQELIGLLLSFITLELVILSLEGAKWLERQPSLSLVLILATAAGYLLVKWNGKRYLKVGSAIILGMVIILWQMYTALPSSTLPWTQKLMNALGSMGTLSGKTDTGTVPFTILLLSVSWILGCVSPWLILKKQQAWTVVIAGAVVLLINLSNLPRRYDGFLFFYLIAASLLVGYTRIITYLSQAETGMTVFRRNGIKYFGISVLCLTIAAAIITWLLPDIKPVKIVNIERGNTPVLESVDNALIRLLSAVPRKQPLISAEEQSEFTLSSPYEQNSDDLQFIITSEGPYYWRSWAYDTYTSDGWRNSSHAAYPDVVIPENDGEIKSDARTPITFSVQTSVKTDVLLTTGQFRSVSIPSRLMVYTSADFQQSSSTSGNTFAVTSPYTLDTEDRYTVACSVIAATPSELTQAGDNYPSWVTDRYLQVPDSLPDVVRSATDNITENATTPHEKAMAINRFLSTYKYNLKTSSPPEETDAVEYFLFVKKSGACGDFASAMTVMLRIAGVPARFCTGYRPGEFDEDTGTYRVLASNRHAWAEIYFPGYGWVEYEATPGNRIVRGIIGVEAVTFNGSTEIWDPYQHMQYFSISSGVSIPRRESPSGGTSFITLLWPILFLVTMVVMSVTIYVHYINKGRTRRTTSKEQTNFVYDVYGGLCNLAAQAGLGPVPSQTPAEYVGLLSNEFPHQREYLKTILYAYLRYRYGKTREYDDSVKWDLIKARRIVYDAIRDRVAGKR
jgi:transglutaminase-like putative cysteine protease